MEEKKFVCECGRSFDKIRGMTGHQKNCQTHKDAVKQKKESRRLPNGMFKCENPDCGKEHDGSYGSGRFCSENCKRSWCGKKSYSTSLKNNTFIPCAKRGTPKHTKSFGTWKCNECGFIARTRKELFEHRRLVHNQINPGSKRGKGWNKGLTKETSRIIALSAKNISRTLLQLARPGIASTPEKEYIRREKLRAIAKANGYGGRRKGAGRSKHGWYKGIWCDSSWELAWVIYNLDHKIEFKPYTGYFEYQFQNEIHKYYPDFILNNGTIVEIKGNETSDQWKAKLEQFPKDKYLQVIGKNEIGKYLDYVVEKYGKNFIQLYD